MVLLWQDRRVPSDPVVYEERYRWTRNSNTALLGCSICMLFGIATLFGISPRTPIALGVFLIAGGGCGAFLTVFVPLSRKVALRVDASGLTLGGNPLRYKATTRVVPWDEVQRVFLWQRGPGIRYLSVERPDDAPPLSPDGTGAADRLPFQRSRWPQVPSPTIQAGTTRGMQAFSVDDVLLTDAIGHYAPDADIVNLG
jgi:hypothetical protein